MFYYTTFDNSLVSAFIITQNNLSGTLNLTQYIDFPKQDIQRTSPFVKDDIVETIAKTTQQGI